MSIQRCKQALAKLIKFQKPASAEAAGELIDLVDDFVHELPDAGRALVAGADKFKKATGRRSKVERIMGENTDFEKGRAAAVCALSDLAGDPNVHLPPNLKLPDIQRILQRLNSVETLRYELDAAVADATTLLRLETVPLELAHWHALLLDLKTQDKREHLFGCYLVNRCREACSPWPERDADGNNLVDPEDLIGREDVTEWLLMDFDRLIRAIQETAQYLLPEANQFNDDANMPELLSASALAMALQAKGLSATKPAVESFLRRLRTKYPDCFRQVEGGRRNEARYTYRTAEVWNDLVKNFSI